MSTADLQTLRTRILEGLRQAEPDIPAARQHLESLTAEGAWPDLAYVTDRGARYPGRTHWARVETILRALETPELAEQVPAAEAQALRAVDYWLAEMFQPPTWWWTQIGIPLGALNVAFLLQDRMTPERLERFGALLEPAQIRMTGQNLNWLATINLKRGILEEDEERVATAAEALHGIVFVGEVEGIQPDYSFHQHGPCLYNHGYGSSYLSDTTANALLLRGTAYAYPERLVAILADFLLEGSALMIRRNALELGAAGRTITRGVGTPAYLDRAAERLLAIGTPRDDDLQAFLRRRRGEDPAPTRNKMFVRSDFMVHHRPAFYASARGYSRLTVNTDWPCNEEGLQNHYIAEGACFVMRSGEEHHPVLPLWNFQRVPGTTVRQDGDYPWGSTRCPSESWRLGGASDGRCGALGFHLQRQGLAARKSWFFLDDRIVCLGAGIRDSGAAPVNTTLEQCRRTGEVLAGETPVPEDEEVTVEGGCVWHDGMAWILHDGPPLQARHGAVTGRWYDINHAESEEPLTAPMLTLWLDHGVAPQNGRYAYSILPACPEGSLAEATAGVSVVENSPCRQIVGDERAGLVLAVLHEAGAAPLPGGGEVRADAPAALVLGRDADGGLRLQARPLDRRAGAVGLSLPAS
jgi:chondroitin AC lyase